MDGRVRKQRIKQSEAQDCPALIPSKGSGSARQKAVRTGENEEKKAPVGGPTGAPNYLDGRDYWAFF
jgi:hypothetical protein